MKNDLLNKTYWSHILGFLISGMYPVLAMEKGSIVLLLNENRTPILDLLFSGLTFLGDGVILLPIALYFLVFHIRKGIKFIWAITSMLVVLFSCKHIIFDGLPRPKLYFSGIQDLSEIPGIVVHQYDSFPSGHTATVFMILTFVVINFQVKWLFTTGLTLICFFIGMSRIYLLQHFFIDVYFGVVVGVITVLFADWAYYKLPGFVSGIFQQNSIKKELSGTKD